MKKEEKEDTKKVIKNGSESIILIVCSKEKCEFKIMADYTNRCAKCGKLIKE